MKFPMLALSGLQTMRSMRPCAPGSAPLRSNTGYASKPSTSRNATIVMLPGGRLMSKRMIAALAALAVSAGAGAASAQDVKVGLILPYTGIGAELAQQMDRAAELYLKQNAAQIKPYTITIIRRDSKAPNGAEAKVAAQELLTRSKVDVLTGWSYSP